jgi:DNA polymerase III epsilon subunit-like protein
VTLFGCLDFETTSTNVDSTEVVQVAFVVWELLDAGGGLHKDTQVERKAEAVLCYVPSIPIGSMAVHGIKASDVADRRSFAEQVPLLARMLSKVDYLVTFNGTGFDVPILERYARDAGVDVSFVRPRHIDVYRAWKRKQQIDTRAACYSGGLAGAHFFTTCRTFGGAHDARNDCRATLRTFLAMLVDPRFNLDDLAPITADTTRPTLADFVRWSELPLPGYADLDGKLRWIGDVLTLGFSEHAGIDIAEVDTSFLGWILDKNFAPDTKALVSTVLAGGYPARRYEDE